MTQHEILRWLKQAPHYGRLHRDYTTRGNRWMVAATNVTRQVEAMLKNGMLEAAPGEWARCPDVVVMTKRGSESLSRHLCGVGV